MSVDGVSLTVNNVDKDFFTVIKPDAIGRIFVLLTQNLASLQSSIIAQINL